MQVNRMLIDVVYRWQFHNNSAYNIASSSYCPVIEYAFIRCLAVVSLFKYKILFKSFLLDSFPIFYQIPSFMHSTASIQMLFHKMDFKGLKRNTVTRKRLLLYLWYICHLAFRFYSFWFEYILLSEMEMIENGELIKGNVPKWTDLVFAFSF